MSILNKVLYHIFKTILRVLYFIIYHPKIYNKEYIPSKGPVVIIGNHVNNLDPCNVAISTKRMVFFLAKKELFTPWYGFFFKAVGCISVDCDNKSHSSTVSAINCLKQGDAVGLFPEGAVKKDDNLVLQPFKNGAIKMAKEANCPIVPFAIIGKYKPFINDLKIIYSKPVDVTNMSYEEANKFLYDTIYDLIIKNKGN